MSRNLAQGSAGILWKLHGSDQRGWSPQRQLWGPGCHPDPAQPGEKGALVCLFPATAPQVKQGDGMRAIPKGHLFGIPRITSAKPQVPKGPM